MDVPAPGTAKNGRFFLPVASATERRIFVPTGLLFMAAFDLPADRITSNSNPNFRTGFGLKYLEWSD
jgi:hypothetical protein